jgi:hypothetical protein
VDRGTANSERPPDQTVLNSLSGSPNIELIGCQSVRQWLSFPWAADCCPCVETLRTVLPLTVSVGERGAQRGLGG